MKNIFKKIGIFGLIVAVLLPFVELPVKATTTESCETYLQNYLFMDIKSGWNTWKGYTDTGYRTFTSFLYNFPELESDQTLTIESVTSANLETEAELNKFYDAYVALIDESTNEAVSKEELGIFGNYIDISSNSADYDYVSYLLHGKWSRVDESGQEVDYELNKDLFTGTTSAFDDFYSHTFQGTQLLNHNELLTMINTQAGAASLNVNSTGKNVYELYDSVVQNSDLVDHLQKIVDDVNSKDNYAESFKEDFVWKDSSTGKLYINLSINRKTSKSELNKLTFGLNIDSQINADDNVKTIPEILYTGSDISEDYEYFVYSTSNDKITESYTAYSSYFNNEHEEEESTICAYMDPEDDSVINDENYANEEYRYTQNEDGNPLCYLVPSSDNLDIDTLDSIGYYLPYVLAVKYKVCTTSDVPATWKLIYNANTDDTNVTNVPATKTQNVGVKTTVDAGPSRTGYKFNGWCLDQDGKTAGNCYAVGSEISSTTGADVILYAQWVETGAGDDVKTGVATYVLAFAAVGIITGGIYLVAKKKNLFKQI